MFSHQKLSFPFSATKRGNCPVVSNSTRCERECSTDADCNGNTKCCDNGCGTSCLEPAPEEPPTTLAPVFNVTAPWFGADPAVIKQPDAPEVSAEEGGLITMTCIATGNPTPAIVWKKDTTVVSKESGGIAFTCLLFKFSIFHETLSINKYVDQI